MMADLLVRLYDLPPADEGAATGVTIRRAFAAEKQVVSRWVAAEFSEGWASEAEAAFAKMPVSCFLAARDEELLGFACYDATARGFFGPAGVGKTHRRRGLGRALLLRTLHDMSAHGYAYAIIGAAGSVEFYRATVRAIEIPDSAPGFYRGLIRPR